MTVCEWCHGSGHVPGILWTGPVICSNCDGYGFFDGDEPEDDAPDIDDLPGQTVLELLDEELDSIDDDSEDFY